MQEELALLQTVAEYDLRLEARTPSYCAGCPHRGSSSVIMELRKRFMDTEYMRKMHGSEPVDIISHGGIGCYSLNFLPPFRDMHNMSAMGLGGAAGMGAYPFTKNKHYVMCGDSTFFHSEMSTLSNAIKDNQDILYIILDNKNTAMTGHQVTAGSAYDIMGYKTIEQDIESVVKGMDKDGKIFIRRVDPSQRDSYMALLESAFLMDGVRVVIADRECGITYHKKKRAQTAQLVRKEGFLKTEKHINITPEVCENCRECTKSTGCPGLTILDTDFGEKIAIDRSICVDDKYCTRVKACPSFEQVVITRKQAPARKTGNWDFWMKDIPEPAMKTLAERTKEGKAQHAFYIFIPGVGGMGLGFVAKLLTEAGAREGYHVHFYHQKGLAQRNGAVVSHVIFSLDEAHVSQRIPDGKADLILGLDYLETVRGLNFASPSHTAVICNKAETPTIKMLIGEDRFPLNIEDRILRYSDADKYFGADFFALSEHYFEDRIYANLMMIGAAFQRGLLPIHAETVEDLIRESAKKDQRETNLRAFRIGRRLVSHPEMLRIAKKTETWRDIVTEKSALLMKRRAALASAYERRMEELAETMKRLSDFQRRDFARRYYDLILYENTQYAERYVSRVLEVYQHECASFAGENGHATSFQATEAVIWNLHKVMAIKDEIWVAHLLTCEEKFRADRERYGIDSSRGDTMSYIHINRPHFDVMGFHLEWDMNTRNWMLGLMKRMKFIRRRLPNWHKREKAFRDWYFNDVIGAFLQKRFATYDDALLALRQPYECTGYRQYVYPKHERAMKLVQQLLDGERMPGEAYVPLSAVGMN